VTEQSDLGLAQQLAMAIGDVFAVENITSGLSDGRVIRFQGQLLIDSEQAYDRIAERFKEHGYTPFMRQRKGRVWITATPGLFTAKSGVDRAAIVLFVLTAISVLYAGGQMQHVGLGWLRSHPLAGLPFAATLLSILVAHEAGHYIVSRKMGIPVTLPYFIPMPIFFFGTMGALIRTKAPMRNRRQALIVGAAGPIAGLLVAIPLLIFGLLRSQVQPLAPAGEGIMEGNSLLYAAIKFLVFGRLLPGGGYDVYLHPIAFAAWAGLLVTMLNLFPAGQLDGGHIAYALLGERTRWLNWLCVVVSAAFALLDWNWGAWAAMLLFLGQRSDQPLDDVTPLTALEKAFAVYMLMLFVALLTPRILYQI
jgi:membrane-associated protease RseP (regulator of RpoE activity)